MGQDELSQGVFHGETVDIAVLHGDHQLRRRTIHGESGSDHLRTGTENVLGGDRLVGAKDLVGELIDAKDGTNGNTCVQVGRAINGVTDDGVVGIGVLIKQDAFLLFLRNKNTALAGALHGRNKHIISNHIQLLLVITGSVRGTCQTFEVDQGSTTDVVGNGLEGELQSMAEETTKNIRVSLWPAGPYGHWEDIREVTSGFRYLDLLLSEESGKGDNVGVDVLLANRRGSVVRHVGGVKVLRVVNVRGRRETEW